MPGLISRYSTNSIQGTQETNSGDKQTVVMTTPVDGDITLGSPGSCQVLVSLADGRKQIAVATVNFGTVSPASIESVNGKVGTIVLTGEDVDATVGGTLASVQGHLQTIKDDLGEVGDSLTDLRNDAVVKGTASLQTIKGPLMATGELGVLGTGSEAFKVSFVNGQATIATNNGLDILPDTSFLHQPATEATASFDAIPNGALVSKAQLQEAINTITGTHFDKWVIMGTPEALTLTETLQPVYWPATTRFPSIPPSDIEPTEDGTGIKFKKAGLIHIKRKVSLGGANSENLYYEMRINGQTLAPLQAQAISVSKNTMSYDVEFYWQVSANQTVSIWANCLTGTCPLNYKGVCTLVEYL